LISSEKRPAAIERFYDALSKQTAEQLTAEQKTEVEKAIIAITLASRHKADLRWSLPFFGKRFYLVFLISRDMCKRARHESTLFDLLVAFLLLSGFLFLMLCVLLTLYMIKSALGIDVFHNFHVGIWDWWRSIKHL